MRADKKPTPPDERRLADVLVSALQLPEHAHGIVSPPDRHENVIVVGGRDHVGANARGGQPRGDGRQEPHCGEIGANPEDDPLTGELAPQGSGL